jgi:hypothetical protein
MPALALSTQVGKGRTRPRPRWQYGVAALGWLVPVVVAFSVNQVVSRNRPDWLPSGSAWQASSELATFCVIYCALLAVVMFGRASTWARLRPHFWNERPAWLPGQVTAGHVTLQ